MGKKKEHGIKTNAMRILDGAGIKYTVHTYDAPEGFLDGVSVARATGQNPEQVFKTLVTVGHSRENYVCVIPVAEELDLKKAAAHFGEKSIELIRAADITKTTGYIKGGCSPVGMKKPFKTAIDESALRCDTIMVSGGKVGLQIELNPEELADVTGAGFANLKKS